MSPEFQMVISIHGKGYCIFRLSHMINYIHINPINLYSDRSSKQSPTFTKKDVAKSRGGLLVIGFTTKICIVCCDFMGPWKCDLNPMNELYRFTVGIGNPNLTLQTWNLTIDCPGDLSIKEKQQNLSHQRTKTRQKQQTWKTLGFPWRETLSLQNSIDIWWQITSKPVIIYNII